MFEWFYDFIMSYIMPIITSIMAFLGLDTKKAVHFENEVAQPAPSQEEHVESQ